MRRQRVDANLAAAAEVVVVVERLLSEALSLSVPLPHDSYSADRHDSAAANRVPTVELLSSEPAEELSLPLAVDLLASEQLLRTAASASRWNTVFVGLSASEGQVNTDSHPVHL